MSHTKEYKTPGYDYVRVIANSDWSGGAMLQWKETGSAPREVEVPGFVLKAVFKVEGRVLMEEGLNRFLDSLGELPS